MGFYTHRGYRVIACATKHLPKLTWVKAQKLSRTEVECDLEFVGFIIFQNKLKERTPSAIDELSRAGIRKIMCTGDNILTAISVARECNLIERSAHCFVPHFSQGELWYPPENKAKLTFAIRRFGDTQISALVGEYRQPAVSAGRRHTQGIHHELPISVSC